MGIITGIQWCDSTNNLQMGCEGCELSKSVAITKGEKAVTCYAELQTNRWAGKKGWPVAFHTPAVFPERLKYMLSWPDLTGTTRPDKPWLNKMPRIIFLNYMGDTFSRGLPKDWFAEYLPALAASPHQFLVLSKWPDRFADFSTRFELPKNIWPGTSITSHKTAFRVKDLLKIKGGGPKFISFEPMWSPVFNEIDYKLMQYFMFINWAIFGGESGQNASPFGLDWLNQALYLCYDLFHIPAFVKQMGSNPYRLGQKISFKDSHGGDWTEWPEQYRIREMPLNHYKNRAL